MAIDDELFFGICGFCLSNPSYKIIDAIVSSECDKLVMFAQVDMWKSAFMFHKIVSLIVEAEFQPCITKQKDIALLLCRTKVLPPLFWIYSEAIWRHGFNPAPMRD